MTWGLIGSHRSGKTTLAKAVAERLSIPYVEHRGSQVFAALGLDPKKHYDLATRLVVQRALLKDAQQLYKQQSVFITDRTPIDFIAYTLADIGPEGSGELMNEVMDYRQECLHVLQQHFHAVILVQPAIAIAEVDGKAVSDLAYMEHINALCYGTMNESDLSIGKLYIPRHVTDLEDRIGAVVGSINLLQDQHKKELKSMAKAGIRPN